MHSRRGRRWLRLTPGSGHPHEEATGSNHFFFVVKFQPVFSFVLERKTLQLYVSLDRTSVPDLDLHFRKPVGFATRPLEEERHGGGCLLYGNLAVLENESKKHPHAPMSDRELKCIDDIEKALELDLTLRGRDNQITQQESLELRHEMDYTTRLWKPT